MVPSVRTSAAGILLTLVALAVSPARLAGAPEPPAAAVQAAAAIPRTADGRPNLEGIWQVRNRASYGLEDHPARHGMPAGLSVVVGGAIPYQPWAAERRRENFASRATADPLSRCYLPGVPRVMYMEWPFQIFQTRDHVAMTFEWQQNHRLIHTNGSLPPEGLEFWMGDSRGRWEGDTLVVDVTQHNDRTWFDMAGNFHSEAMRLVERYTMVDADTIEYEATIEDPKVFTRPWTIRMPFHRQQDLTRLLEYQCQAEREEASGDFEPDPKTWYLPGQPGANQAPAPVLDVPPAAPLPANPSDLSGFYQTDAGGANWGLEEHKEPFTPGGRGVIVDPPDKRLPYQPWAAAEKRSRNQPERGYDDPTAHCFVAGVPRSMYVPAPFHIVQTPTHVVFLHERMSWRVVPINGDLTLPDNVRLWQGDSVGRWHGDTLVIYTKNLNGKAWLNEVGDVLSHAATVVERYTRVDADTIQYEATVNDPLVYTRPWTIAMPVRRQDSELLEVACLEDNQDLQHLKDVRDAARAKAAAGGPQ